MTFLGLERPVEQGREQVFDPVTAQMVLNANKDYINAVYNEYQQAKQDMKDFNKEYGDFLSPIDKDVEWWNQNITGAVRNKINELYANGEDPLRSQSGRMQMAMFMNNLPIGEAIRRRQSAEIAKEYVKNMGQLLADNEYNEDAERFFGRNLKSWDTGVNGIWNMSSPIKNRTMDDLIEPMIKNLDYAYDDELTKQANDGHDYYTVKEDRIRQVIEDSIEDLTAKGTMGDYYYNKALQATGNNKEAALQLYKDWLTNRGKDHFKIKKEVNEYKMEQVKQQNRIALENLEHQHKLEQDANKAGRGSGSGGSDAGVYDWATDIYDKGLNNIVGMPGGTPWQTTTGEYMSAEQYFNGTDSMAKAQEQFGLSVRTKYPERDDKDKRRDPSEYVKDRDKAYMQKYTHTTGLSGNLFAEYLGRDLYEQKESNTVWKGRSVVRIDSSDLSRFKSTDGLASNTAGYVGKYHSDEDGLLEKVKKHPEDYVMGGNNIGIYGAYNKHNQYNNDFIVDVYDRKTGKLVGKLAYDSDIKGMKGSVGLYQGNRNYTSNSTRDLKTRNSVQEKSTRVNKLLGMSRPQKQDDIYPYNF